MLKFSLLFSSLLFSSLLLAYLYYTMDSTIRVYYYEFVPDRDFAFSFETTEEFVQVFTGWGAVYVIGEGIVDASHYQQGMIDTIYVNETISAAQVRGGDNNWWNTRWDEWSPMFTDGVGEVGEDGPYQYPVICPTCKRNGRGSCPKKHCPHCNPAIDFNELGNGTRPPTFSFNPGNNSGGIYNSGGSSSSTNGIFSNIPSDFIDNWKQLDRECRNNIEAIQAIVGALSPEAWECMGQSCGVQEGANGAESGGTSNSMTDDVLDVLNHELNGATLVDPCNPNKPHQALMSELIESLCGGEYMGRGDVFEALDKLDIIVIQKSLKTLCPKYACIIDKMMNSGLGTSFVCELMSGFDGSMGNNNGLGFGLHIRALDYSLYPGLNNSAYAGTRVTNPWEGIKQIVIEVNSLNCTTIDALDVFETIQHELIHADIERRLIEGYGWNGNDIDFAQAFHQLVLNEYGGQAGPSEHNLMMEHYLDEMVNGLIEMNNGIGTYSNFVGLVLNGFPIDVLNYCGITQQFVQTQYGAYLNFIQQPGHINSVLSSCD
ncbi:MAG: hypothetical protein IPJ06_17060 [Saprospiraceae bacterium]|nr:hypothetical protein [Saprospiraceae bacterium]